MCKKPLKKHFGDLSCGCKSDCETLIQDRIKIYFVLSVFSDFLFFEFFKS